MSTGGCPQVVLKKIELLMDTYDIYCIEYSFLSPEYVVQRNKVISLLGEKFIPLFNNKKLIVESIEKIMPDIIFIEEISETFIEDEFCKFIYKKGRSWKVIESTHGSDDESWGKTYLPDKFIFVSEWSRMTYKRLNIPIDVIEYPVDKKEKLPGMKSKLNLEDDFIHILNVGLFTPGKNQKYIFDIAKTLINEKIKFHFIGNLAPNFKDYWQPLLNDKPENCVVWGEKDNVQEFLMACDLFFFSSKLELNPLVIKEALEFDIPILMFNLQTYCKTYNNTKNISFLTGDMQLDIKKIKDIIYDGQ